jgi:hypothetical protein
MYKRHVDPCQEVSVRRSNERPPSNAEPTGNREHIRTQILRRRERSRPVRLHGPAHTALARSARARHERRADHPRRAHRSPVRSEPAHPQDLDHCRETQAQRQAARRRIREARRHDRSTPPAPHQHRRQRAQLRRAPAHRQARPRAFAADRAPRARSSRPPETRRRQEPRPRPARERREAIRRDHRRTRRLPPSRPPKDTRAGTSLKDRDAHGEHRRSSTTPRTATQHRTATRPGRISATQASSAASKRRP